MDLKSVLNESKKPLKNTEESGNENIRIHKKPMQLRDIENRSSNSRRVSLSHESDEEIRSLLMKEKESIYKQSWNKLDNGMKINRIKTYVDEHSINKSFNHNQKSILKDLLIKACTENKLNKNTDVEYNKETGLIEEIKHLKYNKVKKIHTLEVLNNNKKVKASSSKSKSNIDRFLKAKNSN